MDKLTAQSNNVRLCHVFPTHDNFADRHLGVTEEDAAVMLEEIHVNVSIFSLHKVLQSNTIERSRSNVT